MISPIKYFRPKNLNDAWEILGTIKNALILAGGTDLLVGLRKKPNSEEQFLIDLNSILELKKIEQDDSTIKIGAAVTHSQIIKSQIIQKTAPLLLEAVSSIGSVQIRNRGTIGGNICNASPCADSTPALLALDAEVEIQAQSKTRVLKLTDFFSYPYKTILKKNEIVTYFIVPKSSQKTGSAFLKLGRRNAMSIARMNVAVQIGINENDEINFSRITAGSILPTTARIEKAEQVLLGEKPSEQLFLEAGNLVAEEMIRVTGRRWSTEYKEPVIKILVKRALMKSWERMKPGYYVS